MRARSEELRWAVPAQRVSAQCQGRCFGCPSPSARGEQICALTAALDVEGEHTQNISYNCNSAATGGLFFATEIDSITY